MWLATKKPPMWLRRWLLG